LVFIDGTFDITHRQSNSNNTHNHNNRKNNINMDSTLNPDVLTQLLEIRAIDRITLTKEQKLIYKAAYKDITGRYPADSCGSTLCRGIWQIVHNWLKLYDGQPAKAKVIEVKTFDIESKTINELKVYATDKGIQYPKNAGRNKMIELIKGV
jgi:hypothetical protein